MYSFPTINFWHILIISSVLFLQSCGGGGGSTQQGASPSQSQQLVSEPPPLVSEPSQLVSEPPPVVSEPQLFIAGGGVKGPLAFAKVELYALDMRFDTLYQPDKPLAAATTDAYAKISGLPIPRNVAPPYVLVIDGTNAIDRNTGQAPVISKLVTIITSETLRTGKPVYATPYTTLAYQMMRLDPHGDGLLATYYNDISLSAVALKRVDPVIDFKWQQDSPANSVNTDRFSVRWTGLIKPEYSGDHTFYTSTDDGVRLWVDGKLIIDGWVNQSEKEYSGTINLSAGRKYFIIMEYYDDKGRARAKLSWSEPGATKRVIPKANLYSLNSRSTSTTSLYVTDAIEKYNQEIIQAASFGLSSQVNIFTTPPIITGETITVEQQQLVVNYRAAIEAMSSLLYDMSLASQNITADAMLKKLALDIYNDGKINGQPGGIDTQIISRDPMTVDIANTPYMVQDIVSLLDEERALTGNSSNVVFMKESVTVDLRTIYIPPKPAPSVVTEKLSFAAPSNTYFNSGISNIRNGSSVLRADFESLALGPYKESDLRSDFRVGAGGYNDTVHGPDYNSTDIVNDPAGTGRNKVLRVLHRKGQGGMGATGGGFRFRVDLPPAEEYYFAYDFYVEPDWWWQPLQHKMPGLINGTLLEASHAETRPTAEGLIAFTGMMQSHSQSAFGRGDGSLAGYTYDKDRVMAYDWLNTVDPVSEAVSGQYLIPRGRWIKIEQYMKVNTGGQKNGILKIWVDGLLVSDQPHRWRDAASKRLIDGIYMYSYYGGNPSDQRNKSPKDQYQYYDNFIVSDSPITH